MSGDVYTYTPIILRFRFFFSYLRTGLFLLIVYTIAYSLHLPHLGLDLGYHLLIDLPYHVALVSLTFLGVWLIRHVVRGYDRFFNVFDDEMMEKLNLKSPSPEERENFQKLFKTDNLYEAFHREAHNYLHNKWELVAIGILVTGVLLNVIVSGLIGGWPFHDIIEFPWTQLSFLVYSTIQFTLAIFAGSAFTILVGYYRAISRIGTSSEHLSIWNYINQLEKGTRRRGRFMSYQTFYAYVRPIGQHLSIISIGIIIVWVSSFIVTTIFELQVYGAPSPFSWITITTIFVGIATLVLFLIPQLQIHRIMDKSREAILKRLGERYGDLKIEFTSSLDKPGRATGQKLREDLEMLQNLIKETSKAPTWPFDWRTSLKMIGAAISPMITAAIPPLITILLGS